MSDWFVIVPNQPRFSWSHPVRDVGKTQGELLKREILVYKEILKKFSLSWKSDRWACGQENEPKAVHNIQIQVVASQSERPIHGFLPKVAHDHTIPL